jgi:hypothetical protein
LQFDLAKQFLDPYDNENYGKGEDPLVVDTLIAETNAGSVRWMNGLAEMPLSAQKVKDGDLSEYLLPLRGYSVDELKQMKEERKALEEKREQEELELLRKEEQEQKLRQASAAVMKLALIDTSGTSSIADPDASYTITFNNTDDRLKHFPGVLVTSSFQTAETVNNLLYSQRSNTTSMHALVPDCTAPVISAVEQVVAAVGVDVAIPEMHVDIKKVPKRSVFGGDDAVVTSFEDEKGINDDIQVHQDRAAGTGDTIDSAQTDDNLALKTDDPGSPSEGVACAEDAPLECATEVLATPPITFTVADYEKQIQEILKAEKAELLETQAILNAPPAAEGIEVLEKDSNSLLNVMNVTGAEGSLTKSMDSTESPLDGNDAVVDDECVVGLLDSPPIDQPLTIVAGDYETQVQEILEAEKAELLETQAILNAPPAAEGIEVPEEDKSSLVKVMNSTDCEDDIAVLEMDAPDSPLKDSEANAEDANRDSGTESIELVSDAANDKTVAAAPLIGESRGDQLIDDVLVPIDLDPPPSM